MNKKLIVFLFSFDVDNASASPGARYPLDSASPGCILINIVINIVINIICINIGNNIMILVISIAMLDYLKLRGK